MQVKFSKELNDDLTKFKGSVSTSVHCGSLLMFQSEEGDTSHSGIHMEFSLLRRGLFRGGRRKNTGGGRRKHEKRKIRGARGTILSRLRAPTFHLSPFLSQFPSPKHERDLCGGESMEFVEAVVSWRPEQRKGKVQGVIGLITVFDAILTSRQSR